QRFHSMVQEGHLGRTFHINAHHLVPRCADEALAPTWRMDAAQAGHGAMGDMGVHVIDLIRWNFGEITRVTAHAGIAYPSRMAPDGARTSDTDDFCTVDAELASGAHVTLTVSRVARGLNEQRLDAYGTAGALSYRLTRDGARWYRGELSAASGSSFE